MQVNIKYLHPNAKTPTYGTEGAACFDLYAATAQQKFNNVHMDVYDHFGTGLSFEIPEDHVMLVFSRSGHGFHNGASLVNSVGIIDSDYRGEVCVMMNRHIPAKVGDRIAQAMIIPFEQVAFEVVDELNETKRGQSGFGSTGVK